MALTKQSPSSLTNQLDKAFLMVKKSIGNGYEDFDHMDNDEDLKNLRKDARFMRYLSKVKKPPAKTDPSLQE